MARNLFVIGDVAVTPGSTDPLVSLSVATLAAGLPFTVWDSRTGGLAVTDLTAPDGVTALVAQTDSNGQLPVFRGPDNWYQALYVDTGGSQRVPVLPLEPLELAIANAATGAGGGTGGTVTLPSWVTAATPTGTALVDAPDPPTALGVIGGVSTLDSRLSDQRTPADASVTNAKVAASAAISADKLTSGAVNGIPTVAFLTALATLNTAAVRSADGTGFAILKRTLAQGAPGPADGNNGDIAAVATA